ncbi:MAG: riboflavin biosynthesis protein RibF [Chloroflexi bacterium]|nr:riboflavin biosynthesis protein RibF [Chloroflexota bacterium]MBT7004994.1 riboflavin biosynthesis protein RibF [Chloroflexota bacterium]
MSISDLFASIDVIEGPTVATIGTFDGVHLGHQALLQRVQDEASKRGAKSVAFVFREQPRAFIKPSNQVTYLSDFETRNHILKQIGIDHVVELNFTTAIQKLSSDEFIGALEERIGLVSLILGPGAMIGSNRAGVEQLSAADTHTDIEFISVPSIVVDGEAVSSSVIRIAIVSGNCELAAKMLGRNYSIQGVVADGEKRGREIGFPTANIKPEFAVTVPDNGIYATIAEVDGNNHSAATSIGVRPTFETDGGRTIEAFLLDFDGDVYTKRLRLEFVKRLRSEVAFETVEQLIEQMNKDVEQTREILAKT